MENYSLLMGDSSDEDGGGVDGEAFRGHFPVPAACRNRDSCPPDLGFAMAAALELFSYRGLFSTMVVHMREGQVVRYKVNAKADMVRNNMTLIRCPCRKCGLRQWIDPDSGQLEEHLLRRGFMLGFNEEPAANVGHEEEADIGREDEESPEHGVHHEEGEADEGDDDAGGDGGGDAERKQTPLTSALRDPHVQELLLKDTGNAKPEAKLAQMEVDGMTPLYPGCRPEDTRLSVTLECLEMKAEHKWTDSSFSDNMKSWHARLPKDNTLPTSIDEAKKVVCPLDLPHVKYHACINDCALFRNEYKDRTTCPVCGQGRYKRGNKKVPLKVVWYFPITPRLQRYFVDPKEAKLMQWHAEREKPADDPEKGKILTHPADASQWNALDIEFADEFGSEPRNIRLGMSTDGLNPFIEMPTYVVYKGRVPGVYEEWQDCLEQVHKFSGNSYKGYATREEAVAQWRAHVGKKKNRLKFLVPLLLTATAVVLYFTLV
ncbi:hypothetical protein QYE76_045526 [Lolium multiflorum]|uniref:Ribonuclease H1 N-terminal domain-containing protein n=1 Tax=Lolium multiflorum TaxID=4521 RepID=A0AAD8X055_LOLMU|nr:hypothetical protein QYE76_045526 [Lolium multiflorum]